MRPSWEGWWSTASVRCAPGTVAWCWAGLQQPARPPRCAFRPFRRQHRRCRGVWPGLRWKCDWLLCWNNGCQRDGVKCRAKQLSPLLCARVVGRKRAICLVDSRTFQAGTHGTKRMEFRVTYLRSWNTLKWPVNSTHLVAKRVTGVSKIVKSCDNCCVINRVNFEMFF